MAARPPALDALDAWLRDQGFAVAERGPQVAYTRAPLAVTMTADRGEWTVEIGHVGWPDEGYDVEVWSAALDQTAPPAVPTSLEVQADMLRDRLPAIAGREDLREQLSAIADARDRARLGP
jgi:hypothetical protein